MKPSAIAMALLLYLGYLGYQIYDFYQSPESELAMAQNNLAAMQTTLTQKQAKVNESKNFYRTLDLKRAELQKLSEKLMSMKATLSESVDIPAFMKMLLTEAQRIGLQITSITPAPQEKAEYYVAQPFELSFSGVFIQLIAYLDRLSQSSRIVQVEAIQVRPNASALGAGQKSRPAKFTEVNGSIRLKTFYYLVTKDDSLAMSPAVNQSRPAGTAPAQPGATPQ